MGERVAKELLVSSINNMAIGGVLLNPLNVVRARVQYICGNAIITLLH